MRKCTLAIKNANPELLKRAVEQIAKDMKLQTTTRVTLYNGSQPQSVLTGIQGEGCENGLGVRIKNGQIEVVGDDYNSDVIKMEQFQQRVTQSYKAVSYQAQLVKQGYSTTVSYQAQQKRYVLAGAKA